MTEIKTYRTGLKVCDIVLLAGRQRQKWIDMIGDLEDWAKSIGCSRIEAVARQGWARVMKDWGWNTQYLMIDKELTGDDDGYGIGRGRDSDDGSELRTA